MLIWKGEKSNKHTHLQDEHVAPFIQRFDVVIIKMYFIETSTAHWRDKKNSQEFNSLCYFH